MEKDSHYYLKYALALHTCCYDAGESHLIASGDWGQDTNETMVAGFNSGNNRKWHAIGPIEAKRRRLADLEQRVRRERDPRRRLVRLGQLLHYLEDIYPHAGFGEIIGHATPTVMGNDPDSLASDRNKTEGMIRSSINYLLLFCDPPIRSAARRRRSRQLFNDIRRSGLIDDLISQSDPSWKSGTGTLGDDGDRIIESNKQRIEEFLRQQVPEKVATITDFDTQGIPDHLGIEFDDAGEPTRIPRSPDEESCGEEGQGDQHQQSSIRGDVRIEQVRWTRESRHQVRVAFTLHNRGTERSNPGVLSARVFDISAQAITAESSCSIPAINPGDRYKSDVQIDVPAQGPSLIELWAHLYDRNARDNQAIVLIPSEPDEHDKQSNATDGCSGDPDVSIARPLPDRDREHLTHILAEAKLASRYFQRVISAIATAREDRSPAVEATLQMGINQIGQTVGQEVGRILAEDIIVHFVRRRRQTPYFSRAPELGGIEKDDNGDCYVVVSVFAYSTEAHASEVLKRVRVRLGQSDGTVSVVSRTDEQPVWHHDSSRGNNGRRRTETYTDVYIPVSESLCEALQDEAETPDLVLEVTVWEVVEHSIGSDTVTPVTHRWRVSLTRLREELKENECCE
ncbi:MAG: hypothetical protein D6690_11125 [Nitrospirae bacterium]|nr:MAG: hypothetical protein D6690_11125 [Nitrospirota bacterium]